MPSVHEGLSDVDLWVLFWYTESTPPVFRA